MMQSSQYLCFFCYFALFCFTLRCVLIYTVISGVMYCSIFTRLLYNYESNTVNTIFSLFPLICSQLSISRAPDNSNHFQFPLKVRVIGTRLYIMNYYIITTCKYHSSLALVLGFLFQDSHVTHPYFPSSDMQTVEKRVLTKFQKK